VKESASKIVVFDSWAMMAYLDGEPAAQEIRQMLRKARKKELRALFSLISYGECLYIIEREQGVQSAQRAIGIIDQLALHIVPVDRPLVFAAARFKALYPISYADAFSVAVAKLHNGSVLTGDPEFKAVEHEIGIHWLSDSRK
jgi:predicted nucleic acid-binding protein